MAGVAQIDEERGLRVVQDVETGGLRETPQAAASIMFIKPVRQAPRLADVDLIPAVAIDVGNRDSQLAVEIDAAGRVQARAPVGHTSGKLVVEGALAIEDRAGDIPEPRLVCIGQCLFDRLEASK